MNQCYMTFRSITPAQKAQRILLRAGLECRLQRTPRWMEEQGCGYSLCVKHRDIYDAVTLLKSGSVPYKRIYLQGRDDSFEELRL